MWVLWFVLTVGGVTIHEPLRAYPSKIRCLEAGQYVLLNMQATYPDDPTMRFYCAKPVITARS